MLKIDCKNIYCLKDLLEEQEEILEVIENQRERDSHGMGFLVLPLLQLGLGPYVLHKL